MARTTELASGFTVGRYLDLRANLEIQRAAGAEWAELLGAFRRRLEERFLGPIALLLNAQGVVSGFAVLALDCLLIDTIQSFREGRGSTGEVSSAKSFKAFFKSPRFAQFANRDRDEFFRDVRNGLLHNGETRGNWRVRTDTGSILTKDAATASRVINRRLFHEAIAGEFEDFCRLLESADSAEVRGKFLRRMDAICGARADPGLLYFAFGSNLDEEQMARRIPNAKAEGVAYLPGQRLVFAKHSTTWGGDAATIEPCATRMVWGFLYRVTAEEKRHLEEVEGGYEPVQVEVWQPEAAGTSHGSWALDAFTFRAKGPCEDRCGPSEAYWRLVLKGAELRRLPREYIQEITLEAGAS